MGRREAQDLAVKFWNKDKDVRKRCWTSVPTVVGKHSKQEMKRWCQLQSSKGKFYYYYGTPTWWFENPEDATMFLMKWS